MQKRIIRKLKNIYRTAAKLVAALLGWSFIAPWVILMPRSKHKVAVIGREDGRFLDNSKYFFLESTEASATEIDIAFISENKDTIKLLSDADYHVLRYPSMPSIWFLIRCNVVVVDSEEWYLQFRRFFLVGARILQLWHGIGFKRICIDRWRHFVPARDRLREPTLADHIGYAAHVFAGGFIAYHAVNTTSSFYRDKVFRPAFRSQDFPTLGYPRHTFGQLPGPAREHALLNTDRVLLQKAAQWQAHGRRIVVVAPTYRETRATPIGLTPDVVAGLDAFCAQHRVEFIFKFHPFERQHCNLRAQHLHSYNSHADIYPLLLLSSALVTDYSSIYMDYLLLDKPVLFLVPDLAQYKAQDRQLQFDYAAMTPGPKLQGWPEVTSCLLEQWEHDTFSAEREALRFLAFDQEDPGQATARILAYMASKRWIPDQPISVSEPQ